MDNILIRQILPGDDQAIAVIIRNTLAEFGANHPGTVYFDKSTDHLSDLFSVAGSRYFIAEKGSKVVGGAGIYPTEGLPENTAELVKMYLLPEVRKMGLGSLLITKCLQFAKDEGYDQVYLETMPELSRAMKVYEKFGFEYLEGPWGNSGHFGCSVWMLLKIYRNTDHSN